MKKYKLTATEEKEEEIANEVETENQEKAENFSFEKCQIPVGSTLQYINNPVVTCTVADERKVEYNGKQMYLTGVAKILKKLVYADQDILCIKAKDSMR